MRFPVREQNRWDEESDECKRDCDAVEPACVTQIIDYQQENSLSVKIYVQLSKEVFG